MVIKQLLQPTRCLSAGRLTAPDCCRRGWEHLIPAAPAAAAKLRRRCVTSSPSGMLRPELPDIKITHLLQKIISKTIINKTAAWTTVSFFPLQLLVLSSDNLGKSLPRKGQVFCAQSDVLDKGDWCLHGSWMGKDIIKEPADASWQIPLSLPNADARAKSHSWRVSQPPN